MELRVNSVYTHYVSQLIGDQSENDTHYVSSKEIDEKMEKVRAEYLVKNSESWRLAGECVLKD